MASSHSETSFIVDVEAFLQLALDMRRAQKRFFKDHTNAALVESKRLEKEVDRWLEDWRAFGLSSE
jgi:hypothetical protein